MRVAFIGHGWHRKTGSSRFLVDLLEQHAVVEPWFGDPADAATGEWFAGFDEQRYDAIVIWQLHEAFQRLSGRHPNVVFAPMYDAMLWGGEFYWKQAFNTAKIACFSWKLRQEVMRRAPLYAGFQYYPDPADHTPVEDFSTLRGFLWYRRRAISPDLVFRLCQGTDFARFTVHDAPDPDNAATGPWTPPPNIQSFERTAWSDSRDSYDDALRECNVSFAPRLFEGIGMSVLEAMASGHCVIAPNAPAMNEYISHAATGLLYSPGRPSPLDFSNARSIGARARESIERGHERWRSSIPDLLDFIMTPTARIGAKVRSTMPIQDRSAPEPPCLVSVVTICRDAAAVLEATMRSVLGQTGCEFEYVLLDGGSTDGTVEIIRRNEARLAAWHTVSDDPMNAAYGLVRGDWVLFMDAGETFCSADALRRMFSRVPTGTDVVYGHHVLRHADGTETLRHAADFASTSCRLKRGDLGWDWLAGIPGRSATAFRRGLLSSPRFDARHRSAATLDLMLRAHTAGARLFNCDEVISIREASALERQDCAAVAKCHGDAAAVERFFAQPLRDDDEASSATALARLGRVALRMVTMLDRRAPALARAVERIARGETARRVARRLAG